MVLFKMLPIRIQTSQSYLMLHYKRIFCRCKLTLFVKKPGPHVGFYTTIFEYLRTLMSFSEILFAFRS